MKKAKHYRNMVSRFCLLVPLVVVSACVGTTGINQVPGSLLAKGLLAGELGQGLDIQAKRKAVEAEVSALSNSATGVETTWNGSNKTSGKVTPGQPFEVSDKICRRYTHTVLVNGQSRSGETTACRNADGLWEPLE